MKKTEKINQLFCFRIGTYRRFPPLLIGAPSISVVHNRVAETESLFKYLMTFDSQERWDFSPLSMGFFPSVSKGFPAKRYLDDLADLGKRSSLCAYQTRRPGT